MIAAALAGLPNRPLSISATLSPPPWPGPPHTRCHTPPPPQFWQLYLGGTVGAAVVGMLQGMAYMGPTGGSAALMAAFAWRNPQHLITIWPFLNIRPGPRRRGGGLVRVMRPNQCQFQKCIGKRGGEVFPFSSRNKQEEGKQGEKLSEKK